MSESGYSGLSVWTSVWWTAALWGGNRERIPFFHDSLSLSRFNYISSIIIHYLRMNGCYVEYILLNKAKQVVSPHTQCCCVQFLKHPPDVMNPAVFHSMSVNNYKRNFYKRNKTCWNILKKQMFVDVRYILIH